MRLWFTLAVSLVLAVAQEPAQRKNTDGEVVSTDAAAKQLKIKTNAGDVYSVATDVKTNFLRVGADLDMKKATKIALPDIATGDHVRARGVVADDTKTITASTVVVLTKADIAQKQQSDRDAWVKRGIAGTVTAADPDKHEITLRVDTIPPKTVALDASGKVEFHRYAPDSVKFSDAKPSTFAELKPGDRVRALGDKNEDGTRFKAEEIVSGSFRTLAAQVLSIDPETNTLKVTDLSSKDKQALTVHVNSDTLLRRMPERMAMFLAMRINAPGGNAPANSQSSNGPGAAGGPGSSAMPRRPDGAAGSDRGPRGQGPGGPAGQGPGGPAGNVAQMGGGASGPGGPGGGRGDLQQAVERSPQIAIGDLKPGDALVISSTNGADRSILTAITIVAGVEPFLATAPKTAGAVNLGAWSFDIGMPSQ